MCRNASGRASKCWITASAPSSLAGRSVYPQLTRTAGKPAPCAASTSWIESPIMTARPGEPGEAGDHFGYAREGAGMAHRVGLVVAHEFARHGAQCCIVELLAVLGE